MHGLSSTLTGKARRSSSPVTGLNRPTAAQEAIQLEHVAVRELVNTCNDRKLSPHVCHKVTSRLSQGEVTAALQPVHSTQYSGAPGPVQRTRGRHKWQQICR